MFRLNKNKKEPDGSKITVHRDDLEFLNSLTKSGDTSRSNISTLLLTTYGAVISGLFVFVTINNLELSYAEKILFLIITASAGLIVLTSLLEKLTDYFSKVQVGNKHVENIRKSKTFSQTGQFNHLSPSSFNVLILKSIPPLQLILIFMNSLSLIIYIFVRIV